ncbi:MAG: hypothetical protein COS34_15255 [Lysobacterales bacterium CG02_land_8_20_14_3_00_62_12]|nr:MAG: hypothetical protein COS34_15255 [Xanthomonadales bacterium CG02_land_8_20_14_3_00_62_12]
MNQTVQQRLTPGLTSGLPFLQPASTSIGWRAAARCLGTVRWPVCWLLGGLCAIANVGVQAQGASIVVVVEDDLANASISLPSAVGTFTAELGIQFDDDDHVTNLDATCLGIDAHLLETPAAIAALNARLPSGAVSYLIDPLFPMVIVVEPPAGCGLEFTEDVDYEIHTDHLPFVAPSLYRLMKAPIGGPFQEITADVIAGSIRARGRGGNFSEFVIAKLVVNRATDTLQADLLAEASAGFAALAARIDQGDLSLVAQRTLRTRLRIAKAAFDNQDFVGANTRLLALATEAASLSGQAIPNRWRSLRDLVNAEGEIQGLAAALGHKLRCLQGTC